MLFISNPIKFQNFDNAIYFTTNELIEYACKIKNVNFVNITFKQMNNEIYLVMIDYNNEKNVPIGISKYKN